MGAVERIEAELAAGRLWKARDRVTGALVGAPADPALLDLAGRVFFLMGDLPQAGVHWFLTERAGPEVEAATAAMHERWSSPAAVAGALPRKAPDHEYGPIVAERLVALDAAHGGGLRRTRWSGRLVPAPPPPKRSALGCVVGLIALALLAYVGGTILDALLG